MNTLATEFGSHSWFWSMAIRSTMALSITTVVTLLLRRKSAALRHRIWVLGLGASVLIPMVLLTGPTISIPLLSAQSRVNTQLKPDQPDGKNDVIDVSSRLSADTAVAPASLATPDTAAGITNMGSSLSVTNAPAEALSSFHLTVRIWLAGLGLGVGTFILIYAGQSYRVNQLPSLQNTSWQQSVEAAANRLGLKQNVKTVVSEVMRVPAAFGVVNTTLIVPADWQTWSLDQRECILLHELAHVHRRDVATQVFARLAVLTQWFNPLAWHAARQLRIERELASDDCVLRTGCPASNYAQHLLLTVKQYLPQPMPVGVAMAHSARLDDRVKAILNPQTNRSAVGRSTFALATTVTLLACVVLGLMTPTTGAVPVTGLPSDPEAPVWKKGHTYYYRKTLPTSLAFAADGKSLLSADATGNLMSLDLTNEGNSYRWSATVVGSHPAVAYSLDGQSVYATCDDGVVVFDAKGKEIGRIEAKDSKPVAIGVFPDKAVTDEVSFAQIVFGNASGYFVKTWATVRKPEDAGTLSTRTVPPNTNPSDAWAVPLAVDPRGRSAIMTGPIDRTGQVAGRAGANVLWAYVCGDYDDGSPGNRIMKGHDTTVVSAAWSKEGSTALTGDADGRVIEWNPTRLTEDGKIGGMKELRRHQFAGRVAALAVSNNGKRMAAYVLGKQGRVYVWNAGESGARLTQIHTESADLTGGGSFAALAMSADGKRLAACAGNTDWLKEPDELTGKVQLWNFDSSPSQQPAPKLAFTNRHAGGSGTDFTIPNNNVIYSVSKRKGRSINLFDMRDGKILSAMNLGDDVSIRRLSRSPERDWIVIGRASMDSDGRQFDAEVRHANMHPPRKTIPDCEELVGLAPGGKELVVVRAGKVELWNTVTGELITQAPFEIQRIDASASAPDGTLAIADGDTIILWDWRNDKHERIAIEQRTTSLEFSPDGQFLAEGPENSNVRLRDLKTRKIVRTFSSDQPLSVPDLAFTQSGRVLIACDNSGDNVSKPRIFQWDTADGSLAHQITVPGLPQAFDISPNELYLVARVTDSEGSKLMGWRLDGGTVERPTGNAPPASGRDDQP